MGIGLLRQDVVRAAYFGPGSGRPESTDGIANDFQKDTGHLASGGFSDLLHFVRSGELVR